MFEKNLGNRDSFSSVKERALFSFVLEVGCLNISNLSFHLKHSWLQMQNTYVGGICLSLVQTFKLKGLPQI